MDIETLNNLVEKIKISADRILQEEAEVIFLNALAKHKISSKLIFYGGTALRLVYGSPRFSEDIDLIQIKKINFSDFRDLVKQTVKDNQNWQLKDVKDKRKTMFALFLIKDNKLKHAFSIKVEIHKPNKRVKLDKELSLIKSPVSALEPLLLVPTITELKKLKQESLSKRKKARDVFDLWYISRLLRENFVLPEKMPKYSEREFRNELQVFLPKEYYPVIQQLYEKISRKN